jgi:hypothetical protein
LAPLLGACGSVLRQVKISQISKNLVKKKILPAALACAPFSRTDQRNVLMQNWHWKAQHSGVMELKRLISGAGL